MLPCANTRACAVPARTLLAPAWWEHTVKMEVELFVRCRWQVIIQPAAKPRGLAAQTALETEAAGQTRCYGPHILPSAVIEGTARLA